MIGKLVSSARGTTYYWIERHANPDAPCIVFTHGLAVNHHLFDKQVPYFSKDYTVIVWDVPLHGRSQPYFDFSYVNAAEELSRILQREKIEAAVLVGQSMGGYLCQEFAAQYPEKTLAFIGVGTMPSGMSYYSEGDLKLIRKTPAITKRIPEPILHMCMAKAVSKTRYGYHNALGMMEQMSKQQILNVMHVAYNDIFTRTEQVKFSCPALLIVGEKDRTGKLMAQCREWSKREGIPLHIIPNAAHDCNADNFEEFNKVVDEFLVQVCKLTQK